MLPRQHRLHPRSRVRSTIRNGVKVRSGNIVLHHVRDCEQTHAAVVVGKGTGGAVERHLRQRQVRHALASMWGDVPAGWLVVRVLPGGADFSALTGDLRAAVARL